MRLTKTIAGVCLLLAGGAIPLAAAESTNAWWSLRPITRPAIPSVEKKGWARNPIDFFILETLEKKQMSPSDPADPALQLRRLYFDLIGLPPTPRELKDFLADRRPDAWDRVVDRLLASPRYGERWARHWLDVVHYADSHGHDQDRPRTNAWPYRDYLIRAFNQDTPYARFVEEQLAGDVIYPRDPWASVATGFIAAGPWDESSLMAIRDETEDKQIARYLDRDDMVTTTMSTFVSSTVHCARCHNHKFDPITQSDYYNLQAVFAGVDRAERSWDSDPALHFKRQELLRQKRQLKAQDLKLLASLKSPEFQEEIFQWESKLAKTPRWTAADPVEFKSPGQKLEKLADHSIRASGPRPNADTVTVTLETGLQNITGFRLEAMADDSLPQKGPGRQDNGNFALTEIAVREGSAAGPDEWKKLPVVNPSASFNQEGWTIAMALDGKQETGWSVHPHEGKSHEAVFEFTRPVSGGPGTRLQFQLDQKFNAHLLGRFRISLTADPVPLRAQSIGEPLLTILKTPPEKRTDAQRQELASSYLSEKIERGLAALPPAQLVYAGANDFKAEGNFYPATEPRPVQVLKRGDIHKPSGDAHPGALSCVPGLKPVFELSDPKNEGERRADLARWVTHPQNVLTWRSIVNRVWHYHFGRGLVETPNDFGRMGALPSHPELLDWLAWDFLENGGSIKHLHRLIVTSATYRQSSRHRADYAAVDSENKLLWRMNRARLDAESIRDAMLQITAHLDLTMGGPAVKQFVESPGIHVTPTVDYIHFDVDSLPSYRRSVYRFIFRTLPDPFMDSLDCADASQLTPARNSSVTPLQALSMMNNAFVVRQSEHLAHRVESAGSLERQIEEACWLAFGRSPRPDELADLVPFARKNGMPNLCRVLFNSNEFIFVN